nr:PLDc_N domain-containing protein [Propionibacterium sp.]
MVRYLPVVLEVALLVYALVDCLQSDQRRIRNLPKLAWTVLIIIVPFLGPLAWFFAGRPAREVGPGAGQYRVYEPPRPRPVAPDDDPAFLESLKRKKEDEDLLRKWEEDLRRREREFKNKDADGPGPNRPDGPEQPPA